MGGSSTLGGCCDLPGRKFLQTEWGDAEGRNHTLLGHSLRVPSPSLLLFLASLAAAAAPRWACYLLHAEGGGSRRALKELPGSRQGLTVQTESCGAYTELPVVPYPRAAVASLFGPHVQGGVSLVDPPLASRPHQGQTLRIRHSCTLACSRSTLLRQAFAEGHDKLWDSGR